MQVKPPGQVPDNPRMGPMDAAGRAGRWLVLAVAAGALLACGSGPAQAGPVSRRLLGLPRLHRGGGCALGRRPERLEPGRLGDAQRPALGQVHEADPQAGRQPVAPPGLRGRRRVRDSVHRGAAERAAGGRDDRPGRLPRRERVRCRHRGAHRTHRSRSTRRSRASAPTATATCSSVQEETCDLWEMYRSFPRPGQGEWEADATALFDLASADRHPETWTSADAAGLPILPGLVRYEEVAAGSVEHAIRATFDTTRRGYIHPAVHYASDRCGPLAAADGPAAADEGALLRGAPGRLRRGQPGAGRSSRRSSATA